MSAKKVVVKVDLHDDRDKRKALKVVAKILHIDSIAMDTKDMKLTVIGDIDPVDVVNRLRRYWKANIINVGPAKEPEKKKDDKKDDKKDEKKDDKKKDDGKKDDKGLIPYYQHPYYQYPMYNPQLNYHQQLATHYPPMSAAYPVHEETPSTCVIS